MSTLLVRRLEGGVLARDTELLRLAPVDVDHRLAIVGLVSVRVSGDSASSFGEYILSSWSGSAPM